MPLEATRKEAEAAQKLAKCHTHDIDRTFRQSTMNADSLHDLAAGMTYIVQRMKERDLQKSGSTPLWIRRRMTRLPRWRPMT